MITQKYYQENAKSFYHNTVHLDMTSIYPPFLKLVKEGGHILDAGCGSGRDSLYFLRHGYQVTAFDSCLELAELASKLIQQNVFNFGFEEVNFSECFDGIWACASLLHVGRNKIDDVLASLIRALNPSGILYASFKYGNKEEKKDGRYFNCYDEQSAEKLISRHPQLKTIDRWQTADVRPGKASEKWLNLLLRKITV